MAGATTQSRSQAVYMQGIAVPASSMDPVSFFAKTRRALLPEKGGARSYAGFGLSDQFELLKSDILAGMVVTFAGSLTVTPGSGTVASTARWPEDLIRLCRFTANGQANIISVSGAKLKAREFMRNGTLTDRGVSKQVGAGQVQNGTLSLASESWGVGKAQQNISAGTYDVELVWFVPVAEDEMDLQGAIFAQTSSTDLTLNLDWANLPDVFTLTGNATVGLTGSVSVMSQKYSIPGDGQGGIILPNLTTFHSLIQSATTDLAIGEQEPRLIGQGAGKTLLRMYNQLWNGAGAASAPLAVNSANFPKLAWRYSGNETPDSGNGLFWRRWNERDYDVDLGVLHGFWCFDFASVNAFRDAVDLGSTSEFRNVLEIGSGVTLASPRLETVVETIFSSGSAAA